MFHKKNFCHVSSTNRGCPQYSIYVYKTTDSVEAMLAEGYFNEALLDLQKNDVIAAAIIDETDNSAYKRAYFRVVKRTLDSVAVEQIITSASDISYDGEGTVFLQDAKNVQDALDGLDSAVDTKVSKSGDTMTGSLVFNMSGDTPEIQLSESVSISKDEYGVFFNTRSATWHLADTNLYSTSGTPRLGTMTHVFNSIYTYTLTKDGVHMLIVPEANGTLTVNEVNFQTPITDTNKGATMAEITPIQQDIDGLKGVGGALNAYDFGANPTQEQLTKYAIDQIWPNNTNFSWSADNPGASTFTDAEGVARTASEVFNATWVNNTTDNTRWQLNNTPDTAPVVFEWANVGRDIVGIANTSTAGIVRVGTGSQMTVNPTTGDISLNSSKASAIRNTIGAVASNQGTGNSGKVLGINSGGNVVPMNASYFASGLPSNTGAQSISIGVGDTYYTMPDDGYIMGSVYSGDVTTDNSFTITNVNNGVQQIFVIANKDQGITTYTPVCFPAIKGTQIKFSLASTETGATLWFVPVHKTV